MITSVKVKRKESAVAGRPTSLFLQIICRREVRRISLDCRVKEEEWDARLETVRIPQHSTPERMDALLKINETLIHHKKICADIIAELQQAGELSASGILQKYQEKNRRRKWLEFMESIIKEKEKERAQATLRNYRSTLRIFKQFLEGKDVPLTDMNRMLIKRFERYLAERKLSFNTISFYCRILRMVWNRAAAEGLVDKHLAPFHTVCTRVVKTKKRAVDETIINRLEKLVIPEPGLALARDLFLFSYYARGMAFIDVAFLTFDNIKGNALIYVRRKTGQLFSIELLPVMQRLIAKYASPERKFLFPVLKNDSPDFRQYDHALRLQNKRLTILAGRLGARLSTYVARHTWASVAKMKGITDEIISESMGHASVQTTRIYIASLDHSQVDKANKIVLFGKVRRTSFRMGVP